MIENTIIMLGREQGGGNEGRKQAVLLLTEEKVSYTAFRS